jgi:maleate cis-trans isomerase
MPYGMYRLLGPDFMLISVSLALQSFRPEDLDRAVAAIEPQADHLVSRGADLILQSGTPLLAAERLEREFGKPVINSLNGAVRAILKRLTVGGRSLQVTGAFSKWSKGETEAP